MASAGARKFGENVIYAFTAQSFSLSASILMSLVVPKLLGVEQFAYWQLFIFYMGYVGLFHFGLSDGVYLRYGGTPIEELDPAAIGSQLKLMIALHVIIGCAIATGAFVFGSQDRGVVWIFTAVNLVLCNIYWYLGYVFQAANETKIYSLATILNKASFVVFIGILIFLRTDSYIPVIALYSIAQLLATVYIMWRGRRFWRAPVLSFKKTVSEFIENARIGINLTFSNIASSLILGIGRILVDASKGLQAFGLVSFAISLTNFFLQFISQVSMVMFPMLRQLREEWIKKLYVQLRSGLSYVLCLILAVFGPMRFILTLWLPQYVESFQYLSILLPICVFDGKMQLLYNTYLKVLRKEKSLLAINLAILLLSACLNAAAVFVLNSLTAVAFSMLLSIMLRSIITNKYLSSLMKIPTEKNIIWECALSAAFALSNVYFGGVASSLISAGLVLIYLVYSRNDIRECFLQLSQLKKSMI